ncbi:S8 family serine peptidase [Jannaschia sp.]|nr:S8 family serine peptidase [Jannaschia sp.]
MMRFALMLCALFLAACTPTGSPRAQSPGLPFAVTDPQELIVLTSEDPAVLIERAAALGYRVRAVHPLPQLDDTLVVFGIPDGVTIPDAIVQIEEAVPGVTAGAHHLYALQADDSGGRAYAAAMIGWPPNGCIARARVGLLDSGVMPDAPGLIDGRITQRAFTGSTAPPATDHGTRMAEILVGPGGLRGTTLYSANVIDPARGGGDMAGVVAILRGVEWLAENGVDIVNISLAGPRNKLLDRALGQAATDGMTLIAAAGNEGPTQPPQYPAAFPFVLAVTAVDRDGAIYRNAIRGGHIDIAAPGVDILLAANGRLTVSSGTSMAAPFVTNVVAADPTLATLSVNALRATLARRATDLGAPGRDPTFGAGLLQAGDGC